MFDQPVTSDVLVVGGGIAGLRAAAAARRHGAEVVLASYAHGASPFMISTNTIADPSDYTTAIATFAADTLSGGYGLNDGNLVRTLTENAHRCFADLLELGVPFAREGHHFQLRHLSGNSVPRSVFVPQGAGKLILDRTFQYCKRAGVRFMRPAKALSLIDDGQRAVGAILAWPQTGRVTAIGARAVILATGGAGRIYADSTYPSDVLGSSYGLAFDVGATFKDMEFVQFEPTVTVSPDGCAGMEMPTAMLGDGAHLLNSKRERFMLGYNGEHGEKKIEKAKLALFIQKEIDEGRGVLGDSVLFDATVIPSAKLESYATHCRRLRAGGLDPATTPVRVRPAAHSLMGGVSVLEDGSTTVPGLWACGEATGGLHGASRLAGNGGCDTIVFGDIAGGAAALSTHCRPEPAVLAASAKSIIADMFRLVADGDRATPTDIKNRVRKTMSQGVGLLRTAAKMEVTLSELDSLAGEIRSGLKAGDFNDMVAAKEARDAVLVARMITMAAQARRESRGAHQRLDYPVQADPDWRVHVMVRRITNEEIEVYSEPVRS